VAACLLNVRLALCLQSVPTVHGKNVVAGRFCRTTTQKEAHNNAVVPQTDKKGHGEI
jgi:hypothetical protein